MFEARQRWTSSRSFPSATAAHGAGPRSILLPSWPSRRLALDLPADRGLFFATFDETEYPVDGADDCQPYSRCTCYGRLLVTGREENGDVQFIHPDSELDRFADASSWSPHAKLFRVGGGKIAHLWMVPLIHERDATLDYFSYEMGYYLCAQIHAPYRFFTFDERPCMNVAQVKDEFFRNHGDSDWWFNAVDDGAGGLIVALWTPDRGIVVQRVTSHAELAWNGVE